MSSAWSIGPLARWAHPQRAPAAYTCPRSCPRTTLPWAGTRTCVGARATSRTRVEVRPHVRRALGLSGPPLVSEQGVLVGAGPGALRPEVGDPVDLAPHAEALAEGGGALVAGVEVGHDATQSVVLEGQ